MVKHKTSGSCNSSDNNPGKKRKKKIDEKFSVYDFNLDDERVEKDSRKWLSKFKNKIPKSSSSPVDKYSFLSSFAQGVKICENHSENELLDIEDSDDNAERTARALAAAESPILSNQKPFDHSSINQLKSEYCSPGATSCLREDKKPKRRISYDRLLKSSDCQTLDNNQPVHLYSNDNEGNENHLPISVDLDDDSRDELRSSISAPYLARSEGSLEEQGSDCGSSRVDMEAVVIVNPDIIVFGEMYSTSAWLTFSDRYVKVEGITLGEMKDSFSFACAISDIVKIESSWYAEVETARVELYLKPCEKLSKISGFGPKAEFVKLNFAIHDPRWSERQEAIKSLDAKYKATWITVIDSSKAFEGIIYPRGDPDAVSISMEDVELLQPATFINDTVIDFYIKYLEQKLKPEEKHRFHFFNSFFFRKLVDLDKFPSTAREGRVAFQRVCKWTRKVNLFVKDYLFIPVNFSLHWSLIIVCHPGEVAYYEEKEMEKSLKFPCILHMDPIKGSHRGLKNVFQSYLLEEWRERHNQLSKDVSTKFLHLPFISLEVPQQENSFDCGLFLLYFVERFLEEAPANFNPYAAVSKFLNRKWFLPAAASGRRGYIKNILYRIINDNVHRAPPVSNYYHSSQSEKEAGIDKELLQESYNGRAKESCYAPNAYKNVKLTSREATNVRSLRHSGRLNLVPRYTLGQGDTAWPVMEGTYQHFRRLESVKRDCSCMSPIKEEETKGRQTAVSSDEASSRLPELILVGTPMDYEYENKTTTFETVAVSASEESSGGHDSPSSSSSVEELFTQVVEDPCARGPCCVNHIYQEAKSFAIPDEEVDSPYNTTNAKSHTPNP